MVEYHIQGTLKSPQDDLFIKVIPTTSAKDCEIIDRLTKEDKLFQQQVSGEKAAAYKRLNIFSIIAANSLQILELLAATQKLFYGDKQLILDFFTPVKLTFKVTSGKDSSLEITPQIVWRDKVVALADCDLVGNGKQFWFIKGFALKCLPKSVSWKKFKTFFSCQKLTMTGLEKELFLEEAEEEAWQLVYDDNITKIELQKTVTPHLKLKDKTGAFADLEFNYGGDATILFQDIRSKIEVATGQSISRDMNAEKGFEQDLLKTDFVSKKSYSSNYYCPTDLVAKSILFLLEIGWQVTDYLGRKVHKMSELALNLENKGSKLSLSGKVSFEDFTANVSDVVGAFQKNQLFLDLSEESVGLCLTDDKHKYLNELSSEFEQDGKNVSFHKQSIGLLQEAIETSKISCGVADLKKILQNYIAPTEELPLTSFTGKLRCYQKTGVSWLCNLAKNGLGGILADEMGLGKTIQIIALISTFEQDLQTLIVVPTSLIFNWQAELKKFLPTANVLVHHGGSRDLQGNAFKTANIIITSYGTLKIDIDLFTQTYFHCIILDEAQVIKNPSTQIAKSVFTLKGSFKICVTGTPLENSLTEIWPHFHFLMPGLLGTYSSFKSNINLSELDQRHLNLVKKKTAPFILRRKKAEVLADLPERIDQVLTLEMNPQQRELYGNFLKKYRQDLQVKVETDGAEKSRLQILEAILRLRQICCHPMLVSELATEDLSDVKSAKFDFMWHDLETILAQGGKAVIYSQFASMLKLMQKLAMQKKLKHSYIDGQTSNRALEVQKFQEESDCQLFFISLKAGGVGLNLTAADYVYIYDPWWNEAAEEQAISRAHRIGRAAKVISKKLIMQETIEEKIVKLKDDKINITQQLLENGDHLDGGKVLGSLSASELLKILN